MSLNYCFKCKYFRNLRVQKHCGYPGRSNKPDFVNEGGTDYAPCEKYNPNGKCKKFAKKPPEKKSPPPDIEEYTYPDRRPWDR